MDITAYKNLLNQLLPEGLAWNKSPDSTLQKLLSGEAIEYARLEEEALKVIKEINPLTTNDLLQEWINVALGDHRCNGLSNNGDELKKAVLARLASIGGADRIYFQEVAKAAGFLVRVIDDFEVFRAGLNRCGDRVLGQDFVYYFIVRARLTNERDFRAGTGRAGDNLLYFGNSLLECTLNEIKPAHVGIIFAYEDVAVNLSGSIQPVFDMALS